MRSIEGLTLLITGANRGIGKALAEVALEQGAKRVYACGKADSDVSELQSLRDQHPGRVVSIELDVTDKARIDALAAELTDVDLVVSNAGVTCIKPFTEGDDAEYRHVMDVNFHGPANLTAAFFDTIRQRKGGYLYILSIGSLMPGKLAPVYGASKAAATLMALGFRGEAEPLGIAVTGVHPGFVDTTLITKLQAPKVPPRQVAERAYAAWCRGDALCFPDLYAETVRDGVLNEGELLFSDPERFRAKMFEDLLKKREAA